jgi:hypothetical protein
MNQLKGQSMPSKSREFVSLLRETDANSSSEKEGRLHLQTLLDTTPSSLSDSDYVPWVYHGDVIMDQVCGEILPSFSAALFPEVKVLLSRVANLEIHC